MNGAKCDSRTGACYCTPGWQGQSCEKPCDEGFFGHRCQQQCLCLHNATCGPITGVSLSATRAGMVKNVKEGAPVLMVQNAITLLANVIVLQDGRVTFAVLNAKKAHMELTALKNASIV